ncbi:MAG TPA: hypothetical protein VFX19_07015 [Dehalococcoidia bacterium]|nr:hypothetical protein [Dehalococcoidia bacterium]
MSRQQIEHLLQECLEGYDAGLSPEECLSAYPHARAELEPLLREALSLRVSFAATPSEEFRNRARERLMFAAGRDVNQALSAEPDPDFKMDARQRFLQAAGAQAQEALRDVPPPRLPFWMNARRRLLEAASSTAPRPSSPPYAFAMRAAMSTAIVVIAIMVATIGFFLTSDLARGPGAAQTASANLDYLEQQLDVVEQHQAEGIKTSSSLLIELTNLTSTLADQADDADAGQPLRERLPALIERQKDAVQTAVVTSSQPDPELIQAAQKLDQAETKVAATRTDVPATQTPSTALGANPTSTPQPTSTTEPTPEATAVGPSEPAKPVDLEPGQVLVQPDPRDQTYATGTNPLPWMRVSTTDMTFVMDSRWTITNLETDENGFAVFSGGTLAIQTGNAAVPSLYISTRTGDTRALINGVPTQIRTEGKDGKVIDATKLLELTGANQIAPFLYHFATSIEFLDQTP